MNTFWQTLRGARILLMVVALIAYAMLGGYYVCWMLLTGKLWPS